MPMESAILDILPEDCISNAISFTTPPDACRFSLVASPFRSAADSDAVWDTFLPSDYKDVISRSENPLVFPRKKDLYLHLCDYPLIIDAGTKSFSLEKMSGRKCYMLAARGLSIEWGNTPEYWIWTPLLESRFQEVAELVEVCLLDINGRISKRVLSPGTTYAAYLVYKSSGMMNGFEDSVHVGFDEANNRQSSRDAYLDPEEIEVGVEGESPKTRPDGWLEVELGEYYVNHDDDDVNLEMYVMGAEALYWKTGLVVQGFEIRPKVASSTAAA